MMCSFHRTYNLRHQTAAYPDAHPIAEVAAAFQLTRELSNEYFYLTGEIDFTVKEKKKVYRKRSITRNA